MGSPPSEPGVHQQKKVSLSGDLQPSLSGFSGGDMPGNTRDKETSASNKQYDKKKKTWHSYLKDSIHLSQVSERCLLPLITYLSFTHPPRVYSFKLCSQQLNL